MFIVPSSLDRSAVLRYHQNPTIAGLVHEAGPAIAEGGCSTGRGTTLPKEGAAPQHLSRVGHSRASPKWGDSSGPLSPQGSQSGRGGGAARDEEQKRGRAKDKLIGLKSIWETAPETKRICTTTGVIDKVNNSP